MHARRSLFIIAEVPSSGVNGFARDAAAAFALGAVATSPPRRSLLVHHTVVRIATVGTRSTYFHISISPVVMLYAEGRFALSTARMDNAVD